MTDTRNADLTFGSNDYIVYMATRDTAAPTLLADPGPAWLCLGWVDVNGGTLKVNTTTKDITASGSLEPIRTLQVASVKTIVANFLEYLNPLVRGLYDNVPVESLSPTAGVVSYALPDKPADLHYAFLFDTMDGTKRSRLYAPNGMVDARGDEQPQQGSEAAVSLTLKFFKGATSNAINRVLNYGGADVSAFFPAGG